MKALIIGATGATGTDLVQQLLHNDAFSTIHIFIRKPLALEHPKLVAHIVDFEYPRTWSHLVHGDIAFSAMGTTLKAAGSKEAQWRVDYDYQYNFAKVAAENKVPVFVLVSSDYVSTDSKFFYPRMKALLEEAIRKLSFQSLLIFNPPALIRHHSDRGGETFAVKTLQFFNKIGLFRGVRPMKTSDLASAMIRAAQKQPQGFHQWNGQKIYEA